MAPGCPYAQFQDVSPAHRPSSTCCRNLVIVLFVILEVLLLPLYIVIFLLDVLCILVLNFPYVGYAVGAPFSSGPAWMVAHSYIASALWRCLLGRSLFYDALLKDLPKADESASAKAKSDALWERMLRDEGVGVEYPCKRELLSRILWRQFSTTMKHRSDVLVSGHKKIIHHVGRVARASITWNAEAKSRYTGLFQGTSECIVRASMAGPPSEGATEYSHAIAIKGLRSGVHSGNILFAWSAMANAKSTNLLGVPLCTHIPTVVRGSDACMVDDVRVSASWRDLITALPRSLAGLIITMRLVDEDPSQFRGPSAAADRCRTASWTGTSDWARYSEDGNEADAAKFPFCVLLRPVPAVRDRIAGAAATAGPLEALKDCRVGDVVWKLWCVAGPDPDSAFEGGELQLTTPFISSAFADEKLHFWHTMYSDDIQCGDEYLAWDAAMTASRGAVEGATFYESHITASGKA